MANLISGDRDTDKIYIHSGVTGTVSTSFSSPIDPYGLSVSSSGNLIILSGDSIYTMSGISATVSSSFILGTPSDAKSDITLDTSGNLLIACFETDKVRVFAGISSTETTSFALPDGNTFGLTAWGIHLVSSGFSNDRIYIHSGLTATISSSFSSASDEPRGLTIDDLGNLVSGSSWNPVIIRLHAGVTSTLTASFSPPSTGPRGLTMDTPEGC